MITDQHFQSWRASLDEKTAALIDRLDRENPRLARELCPRTDEPPDRSICIHEAGHAAALHAFGIRIDHAFANATEGAVQPAARPDDEPIDYLAFGVVNLAGDMAEGREPLSRAAWRDVILATKGDATKDERHAVVFARALAGDDESAEGILSKLDDIWNAAVDMFAAPGFWPAVLAVASLLRRDGRLDGETIHQLCEQHIKFGALAHAQRDLQ